MRTLAIVALAAMLALGVAGGAAAQETVVQPEATPQWDVGVHRSPTGGVHCQYYESGTAIPETRLRGQNEDWALRFQEQTDKWALNEREQAFGRPEDVVREQALREREIALFGGPTGEAEVSEKWAFRDEPTRLPDKYEMPTGWEEGMGRGGAAVPTERPPTYIAQAQREVQDFSHFERVDGCLYVRPGYPEPLTQVNNRQFSPQWHF